jgi:hypothetical protein
MLGVSPGLDRPSPMQPGEPTQGVERRTPRRIATAGLVFAASTWVRCWQDSVCPQSDAFGSDLWLCNRANAGHGVPRMSQGYEPSWHRPPEDSVQGDSVEGCHSLSDSISKLVSRNPRWCLGRCPDVVQQHYGGTPSNYCGRANVLASTQSYSAASPLIGVYRQRLG